MNCSNGDYQLKNYKCSLCGNCSIYKHVIERHIKTVHKNESAQLDIEVLNLRNTSTPHKNAGKKNMVKTAPTTTTTTTNLPLQNSSLPLEKEEVEVIESSERGEFSVTEREH